MAGDSRAPAAGETRRHRASEKETESRNSSSNGSRAFKFPGGRGFALGERAFWVQRASEYYSYQRCDVVMTAVYHV